VDPSGLTLITRIASGGTTPISLTVSQDLLYVLNAGSSIDICRRSRENGQDREIGPPSLCLHPFLPASRAKRRNGGGALIIRPRTLARRRPKRHSLLQLSNSFEGGLRAFGF